jgi:hypothetical protein
MLQMDRTTETLHGREYKTIAYGGAWSLLGAGETETRECSEDIRAMFEALA